MGWNALSASAWKQGRSPFKRLADGEVQFLTAAAGHGELRLGLTPRFNDQGEVSAQQLALIAHGKLASLLVNCPHRQRIWPGGQRCQRRRIAPCVGCGTRHLQEVDVLRALDTGLYASNLHYLNWSDPVSARVTGMTRYACFWRRTAPSSAPSRTCAGTKAR